jgi:hypothetical protein
MRCVTWCMAPAVFLTTLALAIVGNGKSAAQWPVSTRAPVSLAASVSAATIASPVGFAAVSREFSEPSSTMPISAGGGLMRPKGDLRAHRLQCFFLT